MRTTHRIIIGDSRDMEEIRDKSVHLVVTSPPYWQLKDYGHENQIGFIKIDYEFILIFKKLGTPPKPGAESKALSKLTTSEWNEYFTGHWNFAGERQEKHLAMFPEELPKRLIRMFTFVGDTVLDPFLGS